MTLHININKQLPTQCCGWFCHLILHVDLSYVRYIRVACHERIKPNQTLCSSAHFLTISLLWFSTPWMFYKNRPTKHKQSHFWADIYPTSFCRLTQQVIAVSFLFFCTFFERNLKKHPLMPTFTCFIVLWSTTVADASLI